MIKDETYCTILHNYCCWFGDNFAVANPKGFLGTGLFVPVTHTNNLFQEMYNRGFEFYADVGGALHFKKVKK